MTHIEQARLYLKEADRLAQDMEANGTAVIEIYALLARAHIEFAAAFGDSSD
jgi:hypothetical protein